MEACSHAHVIHHGELDHFCLQEQYKWRNADWNAWHGGYWSSWGYDQSWGSWHEPYNSQAGDAQVSKHAAAVANLLSRGHTIDRLSSEDLAEIVKHIEQVRAEKQETPIKQAFSGDPAAALSSASPGKRKNAGSPASKRSDGQEDKEENKKNKKDDSKTENECKPEVSEEQKKQLKKRLHARYMRFSRSLVSGQVWIYTRMMIMIMISEFDHASFDTVARSKVQNFPKRSQSLPSKWRIARPARRRPTCSMPGSPQARTGRSRSCWRL